MKQLIRRLSLDMRQQYRRQRLNKGSSLPQRSTQFQTDPPLGWHSRASHTFFVR